MSDTIVIQRRFRGPPNSGNGGYSCGRLAAFVDGTAEVTLVKPPPLDVPLKVIDEGDGTIAMYDGERLIGTAKPADVSVEPRTFPTFEEAAAASERTFPASAHKLPMCFVCGPDRAHGDGLRIHCGPLDPEDVEWQGVVAAPWVPAADMAAADGRVAPEFVWAALDCPTAYASASPQGFPSILLGRQAVRIARRPDVGEPLVVTAWRTAHDGRKRRAEAALLDRGGEPVAVCRATWIEVTQEVLVGL